MLTPEIRKKAGELDKIISDYFDELCKEKNFNELAPQITYVLQEMEIKCGKEIADIYRHIYRAIVTEFYNKDSFKR